MKVGFTGTREGMNQQQKEEFALHFNTLGATEFHHGDCNGADAQAHEIVRLCFPNVKIVIHPPLRNYMRAYCKGDLLMPQLDYLPRDEKIVDSTEYLIAAPLRDYEEKRSGTWYTVRYARGKNKKHHILKREP